MALLIKKITGAEINSQYMKEKQNFTGQKSRFTVIRGT
jgi:hypothetical protein